MLKKLLFALACLSSIAWQQNLDQVGEGQANGVNRLDGFVKSNVEEGVMVNGPKIFNNLFGRKLLQEYYSVLEEDSTYDSTNSTQYIESKAIQQSSEQSVLQNQQMEGGNSDQFIGSNASQGSQSEKQLQIDKNYWQATEFETLVGEDDREKVLNTNLYPYRTIGRLEFYCGGAKSSCTGTLIGPKTVATSAHCIYLKGQYCENYQFFPGFQADGDDQKKGVYSSQQHIPEEFKQFPDKPYYDFGVVILDEEIGYEVGWMGIGFNCLAQTQDLYTAGYPYNQTSKSYDQMFSAQCKQQTVAACPCFALPVGSCYLQEGYMMKHTCDAVNGQSGSPLWSFVNKPEYPQIRAIHSQGFRSCEKSNGQDCEEKNKAVAIGPEVYNFFLTYI